MILEQIIELFMFIPQLLVSLLPTIDISLPESLFEALGSIFYGVGWCMPVAALSPILVAESALIIFKLVLAIIVRIKSFIPTLGGT